MYGGFAPVNVFGLIVPGLQDRIKVMHLLGVEVLQLLETAHPNKTIIAGQYHDQSQ